VLKGKSMNKLLFGLLGASVALNFYLVKVDVVVKDDLDEEYHEPTPIDQISVAQAGIRKDASENNCPPCDKNFKCSDSKDIVKNEQVSEETFQKIRKQFEMDSQRLFEYTLNLSSEQIDIYYQLKEERSKEITEYLNNKYGQASTVTLSTDEMLEMGRIDKQYDNMLIEVFGETSFNDYKKFKDSFNKKLIEDGKMEYTIQF
tara:strand:+ start:4452 stop:5057 length:606 start_codon:yes stop_codon:yes gene_type:complete